MASSLALKSLVSLGHVKAGVLGEGSSTSSKPRERSADPLLAAGDPECKLRQARQSDRSTRGLRHRPFHRTTWRGTAEGHGLYIEKQRRRSDRARRLTCQRKVLRNGRVTCPLAPAPSRRETPSLGVTHTSPDLRMGPGPTRNS